MEVDMIRRAIAAMLFAGLAVLTFASIANAAGPYANCTQAKADGACNITQDSPYYAAKLDRDGDGIACEC
jgi:hypothetical protein